MRFGSAQRKQRKRIRRFGLAGTAVLLALAVAACSSSSSSSSSAVAPASTGPRAGGALTVFEATGYSGDWPDGLDPATNIDGAADQDYMDAIFGELFELGPKGAVIPDLATGYSISSDAKTITLDIRPGVKFTDGTPFNAAAVVTNIDRDLKSACTCKPTWPVTSVTATGPNTVTITLSAPDGAFIDEIFDSTADWIASPTALQKMGEKAFALAPVGAGPFEVVSDTLSSVLVLKKNPTYWQAGRPYLDTLTFKSVASDEAGYEALLAKEGQIYVDMSTPSLLQQAAKNPGRRGREPAQHVAVRPAAQYEDAAVQQRQGPAGHLRGHQLRADPAARIRQHVPARPGVHRTRRDLLRARRSPVTRGTTRPWPRRWSSRAAWTRSRSTWARSRTWSRRRPPRPCRPSGRRSGSRPSSTRTPWPR